MISKSKLCLFACILFFTACEKNPTIVDDDAIDENVFIVSSEIIDYSDQENIAIQNPEFPDNFLRSLVIHSHVSQSSLFPNVAAFGVGIAMAYQKNNGQFADLGDVSFGNVPLFGRDTLNVGNNTHRLFGYKGLIRNDVPPTSYDTLGLWLAFNEFPQLKIRNSTELNDLTLQIKIKPTIFIKEIINRTINTEENIELIFNRNLTPEHTLISISTHVRLDEIANGETGYYNFIPIKARNRIRIPKRFIEHLVRITDFRRRIRIYIAERSFIGVAELSLKNNTDQKLGLPVGRISTYLLEIQF